MQLSPPTEHVLLYSANSAQLKNARLTGRQLQIAVTTTGTLPENKPENTSMVIIARWPQVSPTAFSYSTYRVAQNKIAHRRICNISATSGLISKIFEAALS